MTIVKFVTVLCLIGNQYFANAQNCSSADAVCASLVYGSWCKLQNGLSGVCQGTSTVCSCASSGSSSATAAPSGINQATTAKSTTTPKGGTTLKGATTVTTAKPATTVTTAKSTTTPKITTTNKPATTLAGGSSSGETGCASTTQSTFMWCEWPSLGTSVPAFQAFFAQLLSYIEKSNCAGLSTYKVILRMIDPYFPAIAPTNGGLFGVSTSSIVYTSFLKLLPSNVELHVYPYVMDAQNQVDWQTYGGSANVLENVFMYASNWNTLLAANGVATRFKGIVVDNEEHAGFSSDLPQVATLKAKYGMTFGVATGFDQVGNMATYSAYSDNVYMEMYDFYLAGVSPAVTINYASSTYLNNPTALINTIMTQVIQNLVGQYNNKVSFMWSNQASSPSGCIYNLGANCGDNNDFGTWSGKAMNDFLTKIKAAHPIFASQPHGFFQFSLTPTAWL